MARKDGQTAATEEQGHSQSPVSAPHTQRHSQLKDGEEFSIIRVKPELDDVSIKEQAVRQQSSQSVGDKALSRANISLYLDPIPHGVTGVVRRMMSPSPCSAPSRILVLVAHVLGHHRHPVGQSRTHRLPHPVPVT